MSIDPLRRTSLTGAALAQVSDSGRPCCTAVDGRDHGRPSRRALVIAGDAGLIASAGMLGVYFAVLTLVSGWRFAVEQFGEWRWFVLALAIGFGVQVGLLVYLRLTALAASAGKVVTTTGATSAIAMVSCCVHYLANFLPVLAVGGLVSFVDRYQVELFWFGIASNLAGVVYLGSRVLSVHRRSQTS